MVFTKKKQKDAFNFVKVGVGLSVLGSVSPAAAPLGKAVKVGGSVIGAGMVLDSLHYLNKKGKKF